MERTGAKYRPALVDLDHAKPMLVVRFAKPTDDLKRASRLHFFALYVHGRHESERGSHITRVLQRGQIFTLRMEILRTARL